MLVAAIFSVAAGGAFAQNRAAKPDEVPPQFRPPHPADKIVQRYFTIDQKRKNEDMYTEEALPRSREFKRIDSTYYVGWMFEGAYKFEHAADYLGYKSAIPPLAKALDLMEHDYAKALATRTSELMIYYPIYKLHIDYTVIANYLMNCYANTDQPELAIKVIRRALKWNFQNQFNMDAYNYLAWTTHRNRFYTHSKYSFLRNTIDENEQLAQKYLDSALRRIRLNTAINEQIQPSLAESEKIGVYHYRNMLYSYAYQIDSAQKYFELMRKAGRLPHNNYATFKVVCGDFKTAEEEYRIASSQDAGDKRLQEWAYYSSILNIYKGQPKEGVQLSRDMIRAAGTTPGYGWYNIALSRSLLYDGQIADAKRYTERAAEFKELHIGTTLGQSHYEFSVQLLKLLEKDMDIASQKFEHANWWYNPQVLIKTGALTSDKFAQQFLIINQFAQNPERDRVIYKLFSNESTVSWDEIWYLIHDYSTKYFINRFQREALTDRRPAIRKYFKLFVARLKMKQGNYKEAKVELDALTREKLIDKEYEKLFIARLYQAEAECAKELEYDTEYNDWMYRLYNTYPQLIPFTGLKPNMNLRISGAADAVVTERLKNCNINWVTNSSIPAPIAYISFGTKGKTKIINYYVVDRNGNYIVPKQSFSWNKAEDAGIALAYKLFNTGSPKEEK